MSLTPTADRPSSIGGHIKPFVSLYGSEISKGSTIRVLAAGYWTLVSAPCQPNRGRTPMVPYHHLCRAGGKRAGSSEQRPVQLVRLEDAREEILAAYTPFIALILLSERLV